MPPAGDDGAGAQQGRDGADGPRPAGVGLGCDAVGTDRSADRAAARGGPSLQAHEEDDRDTGSEIWIKPFHSRALLILCLIISALSMMFMLASALWQHVAAALAKSLIEAGTQGFAAAQIPRLDILAQKSCSSGRGL